MRVLIAADTYYPHVNGAAYFAERFAQELQKAGHEVAVIAPGESLRFTKTKPLGVNLYGLPSIPFYINRFRFTDPLTIGRKVKKAILEFKPDIIHIQSHISVGRVVVRVAKKLSIPVVATNHFMPENLVHYVPITNPGRKLLRNLMWYDFGRVFKKVVAVSTPSRTAAELIQPHLPLEVGVISNGMDFSRFGKHNASEAVYETYKIPKKPTLLYVGRLDKEKNIDYVLQSLALVPKDLELQFVAAGMGAEKTKLETLTKELGLEDRVVFPGFVEDEHLPHLYNIANCFVMAGTAELQSIVTLEAMSTHLPILGVNAMALPELVHDEVNGYRFEMNDPQSLAEKIVKIFTNKDLREKMGIESKRIVSDHDIKVTVIKYETMYREALKKKRG